MGGASDTTTNTVRYAPYIETYHKDFLTELKAARVAANAASPYAGYAELDFEAAFFGAGYVISSFPSLYDMYGKFMAGLDIEVLFDQAFEDVINGTVISNAISEEATRLTDDLEQDAYPRYEVGMRDINSVMSSTFLIGKALIEANRAKALSRYAAEARYRLLPIVTERWARHLEWNRSTIEMYAQIMKLYIAAKFDTDNHNLEVGAKGVLWPFNAIQYEISALGAVSGAADTKSEVKGGGTAQKMLGGALTGLAAGAPFGPAGAAIGGLVGLASGLFK